MVCLKGGMITEGLVKSGMNRVHWRRESGRVERGASNFNFNSGIVSFRVDLSSSS